MVDLSYARTRFTAALVTAVTGGVVVAGAFTMRPPSSRWLTFAVGAAVLLVVAVAFASRGRGAVQRVLDLPLALICGWAIVCSRVIESSGAGAAPTDVRWLNFSIGAAICALGLIGLALHERGLEHDLEWAADRFPNIEWDGRSPTLLADDEQVRVGSQGAR